MPLQRPKMVISDDLVIEVDQGLGDFAATTVYAIEEGSPVTLDSIAAIVADFEDATAGELVPRRRWNSTRDERVRFNHRVLDWPMPVGEVAVFQPITIPFPADLERKQALDALQYGLSRDLFDTDEEYVSAWFDQYISDATKKPVINPEGSRWTYRCIVTLYCIRLSVPDFQTLNFTPRGFQPTATMIDQAHDHYPETTHGPQP